MEKIDTIKSFTGKILGHIYRSGDEFAFDHVGSGKFQGGFNTASDAYEAFDVFHDEYFENLTTVN